MAAHDLSMDDLWQNLMLCAHAMHCHPMDVLERVIAVAVEEGVWDMPQSMRIRTVIANRGIAFYDNLSNAGLTCIFSRESWQYWLNN